MTGSAAFTGTSELSDVENRTQLEVRDRAHELIFCDLQTMADHSTPRHLAAVAIRPSRAPVHAVDS